MAAPRGRALALVSARGGGTDQASGHGANGCTHAGITLGFVHVGATDKTTCGESDPSQGNEDFIHGFEPPDL